MRARPRKVRMPVVRRWWEICQRMKFYYLKFMGPRQRKFYYMKFMSKRQRKGRMHVVRRG